jgi:hypothetical protein
LSFRVYVRASVGNCPPSLAPSLRAKNKAKEIPVLSVSVMCTKLYVCVERIKILERERETIELDFVPKTFSIISTVHVRVSLQRA